MIDIKRLPLDGFTINEAIEILEWTGAPTGLTYQLRALGFTSRRVAPTPTTATRLHWFRPEPETSTCTCRCHTGTCGENAMVLAERTLTLIDRLGLRSADAIIALDDLVRQAGVDHARVALQTGDPAVTPRTSRLRRFFATIFAPDTCPHVEKGECTECWAIRNSW